MQASLLLGLLGYVVLVFVAARRVFLALEQKAAEEIAGVKKAYEGLLSRREEIVFEKKKLENQATEIFALYEMTKEITRHSNEQEALECFKNKLRENIFYEECRFLDPLSEEIKTIKSDAEYFLLPLSEKKQLLGYLAIKGFAISEKEKVMILAHQFALALRRIRLYREIERLARTDSLTEVHTRRHIMERLEEEVKRSAARGIYLSLLMMDVDHFKRINDHYGHLTGDQVLREIAKLIRESIREIDIVGRYGGEEFCVLLPETDQNGAGYVAERIRATVEKATIKAYDARLNVTISIGMATFPKDAKDVPELLDKADWALYRAKMRGRNAVCAFGAYERKA
jgi:diguanylate cyclase (GGDEF)-like protein